MKIAAFALLCLLGAGCHPPLFDWTVTVESQGKTETFCYYGWQPEVTPGEAGWRLVLMGVDVPDEVHTYPPGARIVVRAEGCPERATP